MKHTLWPPVDASFPVPPESEKWVDLNVSVERLGPLGWEGHARPEEYALEPRLAWTEEHRELLVDAHTGERSQYLEDGQYHQVSWPPSATLWTEGSVVIGEEPNCSQHDNDMQPDCDECQSLDAAAVEVTPAQWHWYVTVETWVAAGRDSFALVDTEALHFMTTEMDPREVEYNSDGAMR